VRAGEKAAAGDLRAEKSIICQPTIYSRNNGISLRLLLLLPSFHLTGPLFWRSSTAVSLSPPPGLYSAHARISGSALRVLFLLCEWCARKLIKMEILSRKRQLECGGAQERVKLIRSVE
jgi:hypothetical protein